MFLSDRDIKKAISDGDIIINDFDESRLSPASYDILLGNNFITTESFQTSYIDPDRGICAQTQEKHIPDGGEFILHPGVSVLGVSKDFFGSEKYMIYLSGKSSLARIGLLVHNTASIVNPGHYLNIVFELCNLNTVPIILRPGMKIAQLLFCELSSTPEKFYSNKGRYAGQNLSGWKPEKKNENICKDE